MNKENTNVMNKEVIKLFRGKYCDISITNNLMEEQDIRFCAVGYDEEESIFIIDKNGVRFEMDGREIDTVDVDNNERGIDIVITFSDSTVIIIKPLDKFETHNRYAEELLMLELIRDRYKRELFE